MTDKIKKKSQKVTATHPDVILVVSKTNMAACVLRNIRKQGINWFWQVKWGKVTLWVEDGGTFLPWEGSVQKILKPLPLTKITSILANYDDDN